MGFTYLKFYTADWLEDTAGLSLKSQALWLKALCRLSQSKTPGKRTHSQIIWSRFLGIPDVEFPNFVKELRDAEVGEAIEEEDGKWTLRSNRMIRDWQDLEDVSEKRRAAGRAGGQARAKQMPSKCQANASDLPKQNGKQNPGIPEARSQKPEVRSSERTARAPDEAAIPTFDEVKAYGELIGAKKETIENFFAYYNDNNLWLNKHGLLIKWRDKLQTWKTKDAKFKPNSHGRQQAVDRNKGTANEDAADEYADIGRLDKMV